MAENVASWSCRNVIRSHDAREEKGRYNDVWQVQTYHPVLSEHAFKYISNVPTFYTAAVTWKRSLTQRDEHNAEWLSKWLPLCESAGHSEHDVKSKERLLHRAACTSQPAKLFATRALLMCWTWKSMIKLVRKKMWQFYWHLYVHSTTNNQISSLSGHLSYTEMLSEK